MSTSSSQNPTVERDERLGLASASSMDRRDHCPGSLVAERGAPYLEEEDTATSGTRIHHALETGDDSELDMSEEEIKANLDRLEKNAVAKWREDFNISKEPRVVREQRHWIRNAELDLIASARPDVEYHAQDHALVINYKTGYKDPTPTEINWQVRTEAVAVHSDNPNLVHVRAAIAASRLASRFDYCDFDARSLGLGQREIEFVVWRSNKPGAPRVPGTWCRYCKARSDCREAAGYSLLPTVGMPDKSDELALLQAVSRLTPQHLSYLYCRKSTIAAILDAVEQRLKSLPEEELRLAGYEIAPGNTYRDITDTVGAFNALGAILSDESRMSCIKLVEGRAIEAVMANEKITKKAATEKVRSTIAAFQTQRAGKPKLKVI